MDTKDIPTTKVSDWQPLTSKPLLAVLGKFGEELGECAAIVFRCVIQGPWANHPETNKPNDGALEEEIADVYALAEMVVTELQLDRDKIAERMKRKIAYKAPWISALKQQNNG